MTTTRSVIARPQRLHQTGENDKKKNVILNEVKNLCVGLPFVSMRFFTSFRMTEGRFVISRNETIQKSIHNLYRCHAVGDDIDAAGKIARADL